MENIYKFSFKEIPIIIVAADDNQPRKDPEKNRNRLLQSIKQIGLQQPLVVRAVDGEEERYTLIDGHRRFACAKDLGYKSVPCIVHKNLKPGEYERVRFEVQNNRMAWKPMEKAEAFHRIMITNHFKTNKAAAHYLGISESTVANSIQLRDQSANLRELMAEYQLNQSQRVEFIRLKPKLRKIRELEIDQISIKLFEKAKNKVIDNAKDFRKLGKVFLRATANENELHKFLTDPDMTIEDLEPLVIRSGSSLILEKVIASISESLQHAIKFQEKEEALLFQLYELIEKYKKIKPKI